jgi:exosortase A
MNPLNVRKAMPHTLSEKPSTGQTGNLSQWSSVTVFLLLSSAALIIIFWPTVASALHQWRVSSAYTYGYLILPVSIYLIWEERAALATLAPRPNFFGVVVVAGFAATWLLADALAIDEGRHIAFVGMLEGLLLGLLGWTVYRKFIFAFSYLWLMVPTGAFLLPMLQSISHAGAVGLLQVSDIPVYAEGLFIQVPQGNFLVESSCAGLNFLLAALALSLVYGKLLYQRVSTRVLCVAVALASSVAANIVRIYLIIALTEWSDRKIGLADDHILFGWGFFAVIMLALMWWGAKGQRAEPALPSITIGVDISRPNVARLCAVALMAVCAAAAAPVFSSTRGGYIVAEALRDTAQSFRGSLSERPRD